MELSNLTLVQQKLVKELVNEFTKINPKKDLSAGNRFSFETINECIKEEERFKQTITKHNLTMIKVFANQLEEDLKLFKDEFGKVLNLQIGHFIYGRNHGTLDIFINGNKEKPLANNEYYEINLFIVSKSNRFSGSDSRYNYCNNYDYEKIYCDFKRERVIHKLESGKEIVVYKIVGLEYRKYEYLHKEKGVIKSTLDELIQTDKTIQQKIVYLAS